MDPQNQLVINPVQNQNFDANFINSDDEPVPITVVLRIRPYYNSSNGIVENGNNKCLYPLNAQEISTNFQNDNCFNSIIYRNSKSNSNPSYNRGEDGSPGNYGQNQTEWKFQNGLVFSDSATQEAIFSQSLAQFTEVVLDGYDLTIIGYGQSGSGKTHTLFGPDNALGLPNSEADFGLLQRFVRCLFHKVEQVDEERKPHIIFTVSSIDVDDHDVRDLLTDGNGGKVEVTDHLDGGRGKKSELIGITEIECGSIDEVLSLFENGRVIPPSNVNASAPIYQKSHHIFSINLIQTFQAIGPFVDKIVKQSMVRFVELASNEQAAHQTSYGCEKTSNEFVTSLLPPGISTVGKNVKGNLALASVVSALGDPRRKVTDEDRQEFYQFSLITKILQDAFGGSSLTVAICCLYGVESQLEESKNTLNFAKQLSNISCFPLLRSKRVDTDKLDAEIAFIQGNGNSTVQNGGYITEEDILHKNLRSVSANINLGRMPNLPLDYDHQNSYSSLPTQSLAECTLPLMENSPVKRNDIIGVEKQHGSSQIQSLGLATRIDNTSSIASQPLHDVYSNKSALHSDPTLLLQETARKSYHESLTRNMLELRNLQSQQQQLLNLKQQYLTLINNHPEPSAVSAINQYDISVIESQINLLSAQMTILQSKTQQLQVLYEQATLPVGGTLITPSVMSPPTETNLTPSNLPQHITLPNMNIHQSPGYLNNNYSSPVHRQGINNQTDQVSFLQQTTNRN